MRSSSSHNYIISFTTVKHVKTMRRQADACYRLRHAGSCIDQLLLPVDLSWTTSRQNIPCPTDKSRALSTFRDTHFMKFSNSNRTPPMLSRRKPQLTNPVKLSKPELHEKRLSLGRWHLQRKIIGNLKRHFFSLARSHYEPRSVPIITHINYTKCIT